MAPNKKFNTKPVILSESIKYQKDSVVSHEIVKTKKGSVTLFAFDKKQGLSEHTAPFDALVYIIDGRANITISGKLFLLKKGELILMPADRPHSLYAAARFKMMLVMIKSR